MNAELSINRLMPSRLLMVGVLILLLASWTTLALASGGADAANRYAAAWERYLAAQTPEALAPQNLGKTWDRFLALQNMEPVGAYLIPMDLGGADLAASSGFAAANRYAAAWERYLASQTPEALGDMGATWARFWDGQAAGLAASSSSEGANRTAAAWERYLAAQTPEALSDIGASWARFWDTQAVEAVGAYLIPMDVGGAELAASNGFAAANRYAAAWQSFLATQNPQSMDLRNMGDTWDLFWANVEFNGIVETEDGGFEVICCR